MTAYPFDSDVGHLIRDRFEIDGGHLISCAYLDEFNSKCPIESAKMIDETHILVTYKFIVSDREVAVYMIFECGFQVLSRGNREVWTLTNEYYFCDKFGLTEIKKLEQDKNVPDNWAEINGIGDYVDDFIYRISVDTASESGQSGAVYDSFLVVHFIDKEGVNVAELKTTWNLGKPRTSVKTVTCGFDENVDQIEVYPVFLNTNTFYPRLIFSCRDLIEFP